MHPLVETLIQAQRHAFAIRPEVGGFPVLAEVLRQAGVRLNRWFLPSGQSIYWMEQGTVVQQGEPVVMGAHAVPPFDQEAVVAAIRADQAGKSSFPEFLKAVWGAGVISYDVNFVARTVTYFGCQGETYVESYPKVET